MLLGAAFLVAWYVVYSSRVRRFSLVGREDFHGSSDALLAAHYTGVWSMDGGGLQFYELVCGVASCTHDPVRRFSLVVREDFHGSSDALLAAHYTWYGVWMEEVYNFMN